LNDAVKEGTASPPSLVRAASLISGFTLVSRLLGLVREQVFAALLGAGMQADAFQVAYRIPNLLRDLFAEGALSAAFVPTYAATLVRDGREAAFRLASRVLTLLSLGLAGAILLGYVFAGEIVAALAPGYEQVAGKPELTEFLTRVMLPFLPLVSFAAVAMGMLNAEERYAMPALAPAMFNVVAVLVGVALAAAGAPPERAVVGWAVGTVLGGLAQLTVQLPSLVRRGFRFRWDLAPGDPGIARIAALMAPATVGLAAVQLNLFISSRFASEEPGAVSWLTYAFRILYLPIGIFGVALGTVAATGLARSAARNDVLAMRATLLRSLRMLLFLCLPASAGLIAVGEPVVRLLYQHGRFTAGDTAGTAAALAAYAVGLVAYTGVKVLAPAFFALGRARVPLLGSLLAVATNLVAIRASQGWLGYLSVAFGTSLGSLVNVGVLLLAFDRRHASLRGGGLLRCAATATAGALVTAAAAYAAARGLEGWLGTASLLARLATGLLPVLVGVAAYAAAGKVLRIPELDAVAGAWGRRS
jgi:putative peptidoglycan lipid II flippase